MRNVTSMSAANCKWLAKDSNVKMATARHRRRHRQAPPAVIQRPVHRDRTRPLANKERERRDKKKEMEENVAHANKDLLVQLDHPVQMAKMEVMVKLAMLEEMVKMAQVVATMAAIMVEDVLHVTPLQDQQALQEQKDQKDHQEIQDPMRHHLNPQVQVLRVLQVRPVLQERMATKVHLAKLENSPKRQVSQDQLDQLVLLDHSVNLVQPVNQVMAATDPLQPALQAMLDRPALLAKLAPKDLKARKDQRVVLVHALRARLQELLPAISCFEAVVKDTTSYFLHQSVMVHWLLDKHK